MTRFGFINHYLTRKFLTTQLKKTTFSFKVVPNVLLRRLVPYAPPHKVVELGPISSANGSQAAGVGLMVPFLPSDFLTLPRRHVLEKVISAVRQAEQWGAQVVGLGGFTSICCDEGAVLLGKVRVAITSGNTLTASLTIDGLLRAAEVMGLDLKNSRLAVIGATGDIGSICTKVLARHVGAITISARNAEHLQEFAEHLRRLINSNVRIVHYVKDAVKDADLILSCTSAITTLIEPSEVKSGAIVCDVAYPANVSRDLAAQRPDVLVFEGGLATLPNSQFPGADFLSQFNPYGVIHGCLAETILLALENRLENFSVGRGRITEEKIEAARLMARRHGFSPAPFQYNNLVYDLRVLEEIKSKIIPNRKLQKILRWA